MSVKLLAQSASTVQASGRVLVVDDHAKAHESVADILQHSGYVVAGCSSVVEALHLLDTESFDVIITDLKVPGMTGLDLIHQLQHRPHGAKS